MILSEGRASEYHEIKKLSVDEYLTKLSIFVKQHSDKK